MPLLATKQLRSNVKLSFNYTERSPTPPRTSATPAQVYLILHGYGQTGARILPQLERALPEEAYVIAPNGPFPVVERATDGGFSLGYSWYFYDPKTDEYIVDMAPALSFIDDAFKQLNFGAVPVTIVGFSQGGYLAPFAGLNLLNTQRFIGIGCEYLVQEWPRSPRFRIDGIHGGQDKIVSPKLALESFNAIKGQGTMHIVAQATHRIDDSIRDKLKELLKEF